ncbi:MAG: M17 family peptidase N-terminal domain-containing protein, partial [Phenylobacterium sp.]|nr:M17 family peptidase N-terminal domain-containing protein [Phenylobacterium sp.]
METRFVTGSDLSLSPGDALAVAVFESGRLSPQAERLDRDGGGVRQALAGRFNGKRGSLVIPACPSAQGAAVILVGAGAPAAWDA